MRQFFINETIIGVYLNRLRYIMKRLIREAGILNLHYLLFNIIIIILVIKYFQILLIY
jgi:hypothetical protein